MNRVIKGKNGIKIQLTKAQVQTLRDRLNCHDQPVQYAGGIMYAGYAHGWYNIYEVCDVREELGLDIEPRKLQLALLRKIREILNKPEKVEHHSEHRILPVVIKHDKYNHVTRHVKDRAQQADNAMMRELKEFAAILVAPLASFSKVQQLVGAHV